MKFKQLEIDQKTNWRKRIFHSNHLRKSLVYIIIGSLIGFGFFYFTEGQHMNEIPTGDIIKSLLIGGFFGFFITNSPCAKGRC